jgi:2-polyprenyl-6-methoxyphenol hydroxylase-like FAD-dependent oxidoreductase
MKVVVIGAGVAGATSAVALSRLGAEVTLLEAYEDPGGDVGSFVSLAANGLRGLEALGCLDGVRERGFAVPRQLMLSSSGKVLGDVARGRTPTDTLLGVTLMRAHLVEELRATATAAGARLVTGERLAGVTHLPDGARAELAGGGTLDADLVVGADGIRSVTRGAVAPGTPPPADAGVHVVPGVSGPVAGVRPGTFTMTFGRRGTFIHVPAPDGTVWWQAQVPDAGSRGDGVTDADRLDVLRRRFSGEALPTAVLAAATALHRTTVQQVLPALPTWHRGHVVLAGDAAHPVGAGQGAAMAIEDAVALATALSRAASVPVALGSYEAARRPRVTRVLKAADDNRAVKGAGPVRRRVQEVVMPLVVNRGHARATAWLYDHRPEAPAELATLP